MFNLKSLVSNSQHLFQCLFYRQNDTLNDILSEMYRFKEIHLYLSLQTNQK